MVFGVVVRPHANESPPLGPKNPSKLVEHRSMVLSGYVDDGVVADEGVQGARRDGERRHLGGDDRKVGHVVPGEHKLAHGEVEAEHMVAQLGQTASHGDTGAAPHVEDPRSRR
jgi:hypothetical protein